MISIFKTNIASTRDLNKIKPYLNALMADLKWTIDLFDCDRILRVDSRVNKNEEIIRVARSLGFECINLETFYSEPSF
ncbi:hypothetical protein [Arcticibacter eurypsychrophilus]|uniref:hypothetical protein n=1 Tax=Arcticibacter eurypsychrophilus TaxID=1434752 RepID=UPI00084D6781|nr:hypothetical protein [Arcticibacter eurypsychrophilus]